MKLSQSKISVMSSTATRIAELLLKHLRGELTEAENHELNEWKNSSASRLSLFDSLTNEDNLSKTLKEMYDADLDAGWQKLQTLFPLTLADATFTMNDEENAFETRYDDRSTSLSAMRSEDVERLAASEEDYFTVDNVSMSYNRAKDMI